MRWTALICGGLLAALPAAGQTILGVLGGTALNADDAGAVVTIDPSSGAATVLGTPIPGESLTGVTRLPNGRILASTATFEGNSRLIEIDPATGALIREIGDFVNPNGQLLVTIHDLTYDTYLDRLLGVSIGGGDRPAERGAGDEPAVRGHRRADAQEVAGGIGGEPTDVNAVFIINPETAECGYLGTLPDTGGQFIAVGEGHSIFYGVPANLPQYFVSDTISQVPSATGVLNGTDGDGALGMGRLSEGDFPIFLISGCCENGVGNLIFSVDLLGGVTTLLGSAGGTRRVHDMVVIPALGPAPVIVEVPALGARGVALLALLLAVAGSALLFWRR